MALMVYALAALCLRMLFIDRSFMCNMRLIYFDSMLVFSYRINDRISYFNLGYLGKKRGVFLGDSGSNLIGFFGLHGLLFMLHKIVLMLYGCHYSDMVLYLYTLLDCIGLIFSRAKRGISFMSAW